MGRWVGERGGRGGWMGGLGWTGLGGCLGGGQKAAWLVGWVVGVILIKFTGGLISF